MAGAAALPGGRGRRGAAFRPDSPPARAYPVAKPRPGPSLLSGAHLRLFPHLDMRCSCVCAGPATERETSGPARDSRRPARPALHGGVAARSGPVYRSPAFARPPHVLGRSVLPGRSPLPRVRSTSATGPPPCQPTARRAANRFPARNDRPSSRHSCREHKNRGGRGVQDDAGGVRRPRIRATTVIAMARSNTSMTPLYHKRKRRQTRTEKSAREERP